MAERKAQSQPQQPKQNPKAQPQTTQQGQQDFNQKFAQACEPFKEQVEAAGFDWQQFLQMLTPMILQVIQSLFSKNQVKEGLKSQGFGCPQELKDESEGLLKVATENLARAVCLHCCLCHDQEPTPTDGGDEAP
jgi:hypothetical protein